jgi:outer membrane protein TolC
MRIITITLILFVFTANAKVLTLQEAIEKAVNQNYEVKAQERNTKAVKYQYEATKGMKWPKIDLYANFLRTNNPGYAMMNTLNQKRLSIESSSKFVDMTAFNQFPGIKFNPPYYPEVNNWQTKLQVEVPIYTGGKISTAIKMQERNYLSEKHNLERTKEKAVYDTIKAYKSAVLAKNAVELAKEAYNTAEKHFKIAEKMYKQGQIIYADVLRAKIYMMQMKDKITEAQSNYLTAKKGLLLAIGDETTKPEDIDVEGQLVCSMPTKDGSYYEDIALNTREDLIAMKEKLQIAKDMIKMSKADFLPTIGAFAFYEMNSKNSPLNPDGKWWGAGIGLTWNIFNGFQRMNKYKSAKEEYAKYKNQIKGFEEFIKFEVYQAYNNYLTDVQKYNTQKENLEYAEEVLKVTEKRFENQMASMLDLIDTQTMRDKIKFDLNKAAYECEIQKLELEYKSGLLHQ